VLHEVPGTKVKELTVNPGCSLSLQRHKFRHEFWHVTSGKCAVEQRMPGGYMLPTIELARHSQVVVPVNDWHRIYNPYDEPCKIVEVQYGESCVEDDIERQN
jgi:mannose-1-phosphate guanylyltransferase/mannose-6-phosphate isomerase